jgi:hypothetical protein
MSCLCTFNLSIIAEKIVKFYQFFRVVLMKIITDPDQDPQHCSEVYCKSAGRPVASLFVSHPRAGAYKEMSSFFADQ